MSLISRIRQIERVLGLAAESHAVDRALPAHIAKSNDAPLAFIASGAFGDTQGEHVGIEFLHEIAKAVNTGRIPMTVDVWHVGFTDRLKPSTSAPPQIIGAVKSAEVIDDHLVLIPDVPDPDDKDALIVCAKEIGLSIYFDGARLRDGVFAGRPESRLSVAVLPKQHAAYPYTEVITHE